MVGQIEKLRVLVIDDSPADRALAQRMLGPIADVRCVEDAASARSLAAIGGLDCALIDYQLPDADGTTLCGEFARLGIGVVLLTGRGGGDIAAAAFRAGAHDYLKKSKLTGQALRRSIKGAAEKAALQRQIQRTRIELEQFAATVAHDVRAPLNRSLQYAEMIRDDIARSTLDDVPKMLESVIEDIGLALDYMAETRDYTQLEREEIPMRQLAGPDIATKAMRALESEIQRVDGRVTIAAIPDFVGGFSAATRVVQNLIANALKFRHPERRPEVTIVGERVGDRVVVRVIDNGPGISADALQRVVRPFQRSMDADGARGSGLGLAIVDRIMARHGGKLRLDSEVGKGTVAAVDFPSESSSEDQL